MKVIVSAPGKCILMGEHAAVYGRPALVAAVDRRLRVEIADVPQAGVHLELPQVAVDATVSWAEIDRYAQGAREGWETYASDPGPETFGRLRGEDPAHLVKVALGEVVRHLEVAQPLGETAPDATRPGIALRLDSDLPIGAGFGSSAAASVAVVAAYLALRGVTLTDAELHALTLDVERRQHGLPSGVDNATVIHGGLLWVQRDSAGALVTVPLAAHSPLLERVRIFNSGAPAETTGAVVAAVRRRMAAEPEKYGAAVDRMETATRALRRELEATGDAARFSELIRGFEACLEGLGVVPEPVRALVRQVEARGGAAKISGAGALTGTGGGSLLVYHPHAGEVESWDFLRSLERLDVRLGAGGVRLERRDGEP